MNVQQQNDAPVTFDRQQLHELARLGVVSEQVDELDKRLNYCRAMLRSAPGMAEVREELQVLARAVRDASDALTRFDKAPSAALAEARERVFIESYDHDPDDQTMFQAIYGLEQIASWTDSALSNLPN